MRRRQPHGKLTYPLFFIAQPDERHLGLDSYLAIAGAFFFGIDGRPRHLGKFPN